MWLITHNCTIWCLLWYSFHSRDHFHMSLTKIGCNQSLRHFCSFIIRHISIISITAWSINHNQLILLLVLILWAWSLFSMHLIMKKLLLPCMHKMPQLLSLVIILHILLLHPFFLTILWTLLTIPPLSQLAFYLTLSLFMLHIHLLEIHHVLHLHSTYLQAADMHLTPFRVLTHIYIVQALL